MGRLLQVFAINRVLGHMILSTVCSVKMITDDCTGTHCGIRDGLVKFLIELCRDSDERWSGRECVANKQYRKARELIKRAGYVYRKRRK